ncbi:hypothetical protein [Helicobacter didelphidarum]|uniref:hypothetical protein n=1 Tax=Helicobacter didelphidarum TaxID=2040648 RepID=UPI0011C0574A|nr:hypothetical protein [Helicobacter didelphidarum]
MRENPESFITTDTTEIFFPFLYFSIVKVSEPLPWFSLPDQITLSPSTMFSLLNCIIASLREECAVPQCEMRV